MKSTVQILAVVGSIFCATCSAYAADPPRVVLMESLPSHIEARLENRERALRRAVPPNINGVSLEFVIEDLSRWSSGQSVRVAFRGGNKDLHKKIADAANVWTQHGNLTFDFGCNSVSGEYRTWTTSDTTYTADIRVAFDGGGYWSLVGRDSVDSSIVGASETSLNLGGFDVGLPSDWGAVVIHEFGHAIGFHHEHQNPLGGCDEEFDWDLIYAYLAGPPNYWPKYKVDHNLRALPNSDAYLVSAHDPQSIMHYSFGTWMFKQGADSPCYTPENTTLSEGDRAGMLRAYPRDNEAVVAQTSSRESRLSDLLRAQKLKPDEVKRMKDQWAPRK